MPTPKTTPPIPHRPNSTKISLTPTLRLESATLAAHSFYECTFINCRITECQLLHCTFTDCEFQDCAITSLTTKYSTLKNARFINCSLVGVHWGDLQSRYCPAIARLSNCRMKYNSFVEMNLTKERFLQNGTDRLPL